MKDRTIRIPESKDIPLDLRLYVGDVYVIYKRIENGILFQVLLDDEKEAIDVATAIVKRIMYEQDETTRGVTWRTVSLEVKPQQDRIKLWTYVEWKYRIRDVY